MTSPEDGARFSAAEMERIIELSSGSQDSAEAGRGSSSEDLSLATIKSIAGEVGIPPVAVEKAAAVVLRERTLPPRVSRGTYQGERRLPRIVSQDQLRFMAQEAEAFFGVEGKVRETDGYLEWQSSRAKAFVGLVNEPQGVRVRAILDRWQGSLFGGLGVALPGLWLAGLLATRGTGVVGALGALGGVVGSVVVTRAFLRWRSRRIGVELDGLLDAIVASPALRRIGPDRDADGIAE